MRRNTLLSVILMLATGPCCAPSRTWSWPSGVMTFSCPCLIGGVTKACIGFSLQRYGVARLTSVLAPAWPALASDAPATRVATGQSQPGLARRLWHRRLLPAALAGGTGTTALWQSLAQRLRHGLRRRQGGNNGGKNCARGTPWPVISRRIGQTPRRSRASRRRRH